MYISKAFASNPEPCEQRSNKSQIGVSGRQDFVQRVVKGKWPGGRQKRATEHAVVSTLTPGVGFASATTPEASRTSSESHDEKCSGGNRSLRVFSEYVQELLDTYSREGQEINAQKEHHVSEKCPGEPFESCMRGSTQGDEGKPRSR